MSVWNMKQILPVILKYCIQYLHVQFYSIISAYKRRQLCILEVQQESQRAAMSSHSDTAWRRFQGGREESQSSQSSCRAWYSSGCRDYKQGNINFICPFFVDFHITEMCCNQNVFFFIVKAECFPEHFHTNSSTDC